MSGRELAERYFRGDPLDTTEEAVDELAGIIDAAVATERAAILAIIAAESNPGGTHWEGCEESHVMCWIVKKIEERT